MSGAESAGELPQLWAGAWDPHDANRFVSAGGNHIQARSPTSLHVFCITLQTCSPQRMTVFSLLTAV